MARDKARDDKFFSWSEEHERNYVASLYDESDVVLSYLIKACADKTISYSTHAEVYKLIKDNLGFDLPF